MEVYPSFLMLILSLTAQQTICKPMNSDDGQMKMTNKLCPGAKRCEPGQEEKSVLHDDKHLKTMDAGRKVDKMYDDTTEGKEVDILYSDQSLESSLINDKPLNDKPSGIRSGRMTLT